MSFTTNHPADDDDLEELVRGMGGRITTPFGLDVSSTFADLNHLCLDLHPEIDGEIKILDRQAKDGILHETIYQIENEFENRLVRLKSDISEKHEDWLRCGILKCDEMKIKEKICFDPHTMEIIGFVGGAVNQE